MPSLKAHLDAHTQPGSLGEEAGAGNVRCLACAHTCLVKPGGRGICKMRFNQAGSLMAPWGYVAALNVDPIEKKPLAHFLPGSGALTFGMLGCNFHCDFCQNWISSQALRDPAADRSGSHIQEIAAEAMVAHALRSGAASVVSSYNEPLITTEWAIEIFRLAKTQGLRTAYVSNGFASTQALEALAPVLDAYKVDLKCMTDKKYRQLGGRLGVVTDTIRRAHEMGMWVEVVTLVVPDFNNSEAELREMADFLVSVSPDIPWHVTSYYPTYKHTGSARTSACMLQRAADIGQAAGLHYVYAGNLPGLVGPLENTYCPSCQRILVVRSGYVVRENFITAEGKCPKCGTAIAGVWR